MAKDGQACDFSYVYVNEACARLECRSRNILYRKSFLSHYPDADTRRLPAYYETAMHGGRQMFYDFSPERSKYLKIECFQFHEGYCGCLIEDVTDQHYFELYGNNELGLLNQVVNGGILLTSYQADSPEVIYMNSRLLHALGYCSLSEYKLLSADSLSFLKQLHPDDTHTFQETMTVFSTDDTVRSCIIRIRSSGGWGFPYQSMKTQELSGALSAEDLLRIIYRCHGIPAISVSAYGPGIILRQHSAAHHHLYGGGSSP